MSSGISVVLCCAREDEPHLGAVVEHLRREGIEPRLLVGVDEGTQRLGEAVDQERGRALFVACKSEHLGPGDVLRLEGIFGARKGPAHRLVAVRLTADNPLALVKDIRAAISGFGNAPRPAPEEQAGMREVIQVGGISAVGSDARSAMTSRERMLDRETPADPLAVPLTGRAAEHAARVPPHQSGAWRADSTKSERAIPVVAAGAGAPVVPASLLPEPQVRGASKTTPVLLGAVLVALLGVAYLALREPPPAPAPAAAVAVPQPSAPAPAPTPAPAPAPGFDDAGEPYPEPEPERAPPPVPVPGPEPGEEAGAAEPEGEEPGAGEPSGAEAGSPGAGDQSTAIAEAIANGEMRALDLLLVLESDLDAAWPKAVDHCRAKRAAGLKNWRLPTLPELKKLRGARLLKAGRYWSSTRPAGSDEVYVLDRDTRKVELVPKDEEGLAALCVRQH